ncbi:MAG: L-2-amino-thiazoline-4-carboxylic acid hydrolase, partial [Candidatus Bathyarchaeota archaeon]|nr:L-2-amino-thiazoline-4-carboxylic acid hydrolase [Candidatus Bathyarchaeota archaeon]
MRKPEDTKIVIIGMGYLAGYLYPCYERYITKNNLPTQVIAVTADEPNLASKRAQYPFEILLNDNMKALKTLHPDIILFAPPPTVAPGLAENVLKEYYGYLREHNMPLPDLYAFPPTPAGKYYRDLLGDDIYVCNLLPNMVSEIGGRKLSPGEGNTLVTYPSGGEWATANKERLVDFFSPLGSVVEVKTEHVLHVLASSVCMGLFSLQTILVAETLSSQGYTVSHSDVASAYRYWHQKNRDYYVEESVPSPLDAVPSEGGAILGDIYEAWYSGASKYLYNIGVDPKTVNRLLTVFADLYLQSYQVGSKDQIMQNVRNHATKGGVLERGCLCFDLFVRDKMKSTIETGLDKIDADFIQWVEDISYNIAEIVANHGKRLSGSAEKKAFTPKNHAILLGLFARNAKEMAGEQGRTAVENGVIQYGMERGARMAKRAENNGDELTSLNFQVYGEWTSEPGDMEVNHLKEGTQYIAEVTKCPWYTTWQSYGFLEEGISYCKHIDESVSKGYSEDVPFSVLGVRPLGESSCKFVWKDLVLDKETLKKISMKKQSVSETTIKDWEYHSQHLFSSLKNSLVEALGNGATEIVD